MQGRLVKTCVEILCSLSPIGMNVNNIIKQTSSDRSHVVQAINTLRNGKLITKEGSKSHSQMILVRPTKLANELNSIVSQIIQYNKSYSDFVRATNENFEQYMDDYFKLRRLSVPPDARRILNNKLIFNGWKKEEIKFFERWINVKFEIEGILTKQIFHALIYRYLTIGYKFSVNKIAQEIVTNLLMSELRNQISMVIEGIYPKLGDKITNSEKRDSIVRGLFSDFHDSVLSDVLGLYGGSYNLVDCRFMTEEINNLIFSILDLFGIGKTNLENGIVLIMSDNMDALSQRNTSGKVARTVSIKDFNDRDILRGIFQKLLDLKSD